jgi:hypothetical protein
MLRLSAKESPEFFDHRPLSHAQYPFLGLDLKPMGSILGQPGTLARRISVQRAATVGPRSTVCQVFIKNTHAVKDSCEASTPGVLAVSRSQSLLSTHRIPILAPKRMDRIRMEHELGKVWTKGFLPYPGMSGNRGEQLLRASASSMMRKLSRASIASGFTKRSASFTSLTNVKFEEEDESENLPAYSGMVNPTDAGCDPRTFSANGSRLHSKSESTGQVSLRRIIPPTRTSSRHGTRSRDSRGGFRTGGRESTNRSWTANDGSTISGTPVKREEKTLRNRWSSPLSLVRSLSTEGMKRMFN